MMKLAVTLFLLATHQAVLAMDEDQESPEKKLIHKVLKVLGEMAASNDFPTTEMQTENDFDDFPQENEGFLPDNDDDAALQNDDDMQKRFYIKVSRQFCPPNAQCMKWRGRHRWQNCECRDRKKCRTVTRLTSRCM